VLESLEHNGYLSHIHTSSGRVPTQEGFRHYVDHLDVEELAKHYPVRCETCSPGDLSVEELIDAALNSLARMSGYTSFVAISGRRERVSFRGARFMLDQPEFEDIRRLKNLFYALEVRINNLQDLLFSWIDEPCKILIGDDIGFDEISDCSLIISGLRDPEVSFSLALLGPMRMDYVKAAACLNAMKSQLAQAIEMAL